MILAERTPFFKSILFLFVQTLLPWGLFWVFFDSFSNLNWLNKLLIVALIYCFNLIMTSSTYLCSFHKLDQFAYVFAFSIFFTYFSFAKIEQAIYLKYIIAFTITSFSLILIWFLIFIFTFWRKK
jgi:hypothetical protein